MSLTTWFDMSAGGQRYRNKLDATTQNLDRNIKFSSICEMIDMDKLNV